MSYRRPMTGSYPARTFSASKIKGEFVRDVLLRYFESDNRQFPSFFRKGPLEGG